MKNWVKLIQAVYAYLKLQMKTRENVIKVIEMTEDDYIYLFGNIQQNYLLEARSIYRSLYIEFHRHKASVIQ